jgi:hypothetical protein
VLSPSRWSDGTMDYPQRWFWNNGRLTNDRDGDREFILLHFMRWKTARYMQAPPTPSEGAWVGLKNIMQIDWRKAAAQGFCISPAGITALPPSMREREARADRGRSAMSPP